MSNTAKYWLCQLAGWGTWVLLNLYSIYKFSDKLFLSNKAKVNFVILEVLIYVFCLLLGTHILRFVLKKINWIQFSISGVVFTFLLGVVCTGSFSFSATKLLQKIPAKNLESIIKEERKVKALDLEKQMKLDTIPYYLFETTTGIDSTKYKAFNRIKTDSKWYRGKDGKWIYDENTGSSDFGNVLGFFVLIATWLLLYMIWHYLAKNRKDQVKNLKLEGLVKSLELKTIRSHINPHFIFNALNSIRALVDEDPTRARKAITELSNILRSSLQAEKQETVLLQQEINIVTDYLALEQMRFEERLRIEMQIDKNTLALPIPPMMLQNLVENAIKHGISKDVNGGVIIIKTIWRETYYEIIVQNTGNLQPLKQGNSTGFGLQSTQDRLNLLYQNKAHFTIGERNNNMVECKITIPIEH
jgi:two-component system, LytTR family, sensor kinase